MTPAILFSLLLATGSTSLAEKPSKIQTHRTAPTPANPKKGLFVNVRGQKLYYQISGNGPNLLLLHGGLSSSEDFKTIIPGLSPHYRVITVDRMGHGRSSDSGEPFNYASMAQDMAAFLDVIGVQSTNVVGWSDGGIVGYHLASHFPRLVNKLVTMGSNSRIDGMSHGAAKWIGERPTPESLLADLPEVAANYKRLSPNPQHLLDFLRRSRELWLRDPYIKNEDLNQIKAPVLLIAGDSHDIRLEHLLELRALIGRSQLCILPGSHAILQEKPQFLLAILKDFLSSNASFPLGQNP